jgi:AcrR family transcriptional regulator
MNRQVCTVKVMARPSRSETNPPVGTARERLLAAANELFYEEGIHTVGIDRVIERAGVAKASLYSTFGSKDELVQAYLAERAEIRRERITARVEKETEPRAKLLAIFDELCALVERPNFRGCAFINASAEGPRESSVTRACAFQRSWLRELITTLARETGAEDPTFLANQLQLIYDGALVAASLDRDIGAAARARETAEILIAGQLPGASAHFRTEGQLRRAVTRPDTEVEPQRARTRSDDDTQIRRAPARSNDESQLRRIIRSNDESQIVRVSPTNDTRRKPRR